MDFDRQAIERRDFPIGRRGYDPAAVDAHLRALASEFEELQRAASSGKADVSLAATAGTQVQSILEAAEATASEIEQNAEQGARQVRDSASQQAERTREEALEKARAQVAAVSQVCEMLLERVGSMDTEVNALLAGVRTGAGRLAADLSAVEAGMDELYGAAAGHPAGAAPERPVGAFESPPDSPAEAPAASLQPAAAVKAAPAAAAEPDPADGGGDLDGARLIALNMALNGKSRSDTERYLAENFQLPDRLKLVDEVYAAIEG